MCKTIFNCSVAICWLMSLCTTVRAAGPTTQPDATKAITLADGTSVELLGLCNPNDPGKWWNAAGKPIDPQADPMPADEAKAYNLCAIVDITPPAGSDISHEFSITNNAGPQMSTNPQRGGVIQSTRLIAWKMKPDSLVANFKIKLTSNEWKVLFKDESPTGSYGTSSDDRYAMFAPLRLNEKGNASLTVSFNIKDEDFQIVAFDADNKEHSANGGYVGSNEWRQTTADVDIPPDQIKRIEFHTRPFDRSVEFRNLPLDPDHPVAAEAIVKESPAH